MTPKPSQITKDQLVTEHFAQFPLCLVSTVDFISWTFLGQFGLVVVSKHNRTKTKTKDKQRSSLKQISPLDYCFMVYRSKLDGFQFSYKRERQPKGISIRLPCQRQSDCGAFLLCQHIALWTHSRSLWTNYNYIPFLGQLSYLGAIEKKR